MKRSSLIAVALSATALFCGARSAVAGDFDAAGNYVAAADATFFEDFASPTRYQPDGTDPSCDPLGFTVVNEADALSGDTAVSLKTLQNCPERFLATLPATQASYRASVWIRHGAAAAQIIVHYPDAANHSDVLAQMAPTGRATSDGWIELASNDVPVDMTGANPPNVYLWMTDFADQSSLDVDAFEMVPHGAYVSDLSCVGVRDPICGDGICIGGVCRNGGVNVPPLPEGQLKNDMVDTLEGQLDIFFGGKKTRTSDLPLAIETMEKMRGASTAWQFWNGWATAIHQLHDWHTDTRGTIVQSGPALRLNACFFEGDADLSHSIVPKDAKYRDILVSHVGPDSGGLNPGDRLVAVDGVHPIEWARSLYDVNWEYHVASDDSSFADSAEELGGPIWSGGAFIIQYAKNITVIRCQNGSCDGPPETIDVQSLTSNTGGNDVACDNRPFYHLDAESPNAATHYVFSHFFQGPVSGTTPEEAIYGMVFDSLDGNGDPQSTVNSTLRNAITFWQANARGVILDHRAGNGGTLDAASTVTEIARLPQTVAVIRMPIAVASYAGPATAAEGLALFEAEEAIDPYTVGSSSVDTTLPVALLLHRDGSASDYMPYAMKGSPNTKLFGPGPTAGAFSTYIQFNYWGGLNYQFASGDTISSAGESLMGHAVIPDFIVQQKQSDILAGKDSIHEAALAWLRTVLK